MIPKIIHFGGDVDFKLRESGWEGRALPTDKPEFESAVRELSKCGGFYLSKNAQLAWRLDQYLNDKAVAFQNGRGLSQLAFGSEPNGKWVTAMHALCKEGKDTHTVMQAIPFEVTIVPQLPVPTIPIIHQKKPIRILTHAWHTGHQYELCKVPNTEWTISEQDRMWSEKSRPKPSNFRHLPYCPFKPDDYDLILKFMDQDSKMVDLIEDHGGHPRPPIKTEYLAKVKAMPLVVVINGSPVAGSSDGDITITRMRTACENAHVVFNSYRSQEMWGKIGLTQRTIIHGIDPGEWPSLEKKPVIVTVLGGGREKYYNTAYFNETVKELKRLGVEHVHIGARNLLPDWDAYRSLIGSCIAYFNPTKEAPMPRSRTEAMMCGAAIFTLPNHGAETFIKHGLNGFHLTGDAKKDAEFMAAMVEPELLTDLLRAGVEGQETARQLFHVERFKKEWSELIEEVLEKKSTPVPVSVPWKIPGPIPKYSISILAWDRFDLTTKCIGSVFAHSSDYELILTDNGSRDGVVNYFKELSKLPNIQYVRNTENQGFQTPSRKALELARGEYFVMLNNDAEVPVGWLEKLEKVFKDNPKAAIAGASGCCTALKADFNGSPGPLEYIEGSCAMVKTALVKQHGLFSNYLRHCYGEDSDLSLRMRELGYSVHEADLTITHLRGQTTKNDPKVPAAQKENHAALIKRWGHYLACRRMDYPIIINRRGANGDVLLLTPIIRALKQQKPLSDIYVSTDCEEVLRGNPYLKGFLPKGKTLANSQVIDLDMAYENSTMTNIVDSYAKACGVVDYDRVTEIYHESEWSCPAEDRGICAIHAGPHFWKGKTWPLDRFDVLSKLLKKAGWDVVLVGNQPEKAVSCTFNLTGQTTVGKLIAVIKRASLFIGIDSFPMHVAQAVGTPTIGLFGATLPDLIMTDGSAHIGIASHPSIPCSGERHKVIGKKDYHCDGECMRSITVERVLNAVKSLTR